MTSWWCEFAAIDGAVREGVTITAHEGRFTTIVPDTAPPADAERLHGLTIPGLANTHSHGCCANAKKGQYQVRCHRASVGIKPVLVWGWPARRCRRY